MYFFFKKNQKIFTYTILDLLFKSPGPVLTQVNEWYRSASATIGINPDYTHHISEYMEEAGFVDVQVQVYDIPIGEWPDTDCGFAISFLLLLEKPLLNILIGYKHF